MSQPSRIDELRKRFDENPRRYFAPLANEYRKAGDLDQAIALCAEFIGAQPGNMNGHVVYGQALFDAGRYDEAQATFRTAVQLDPENLIALRHLGDIARANGENAAARDWYRRVLDADPRNEEIIAYLEELNKLVGPEAVSPADAATTGVDLPFLDVSEEPPRQPMAPTPIIAMPAIDEWASSPHLVRRSGPSEAVVDLATDFPGDDSADLGGALSDLAASDQPVAEPLFGESPLGAEPEQSAGAEETNSVDVLPFSEPSLLGDAPVSGVEDIDAAAFDFPAAPLDEDPFGFETEPTAISLEPATVDAVVNPVEDSDSAELVAMGDEEASDSAELVAVGDEPVEETVEAVADDASVIEPERATILESAAFVTETMAELYLSQGFPEKALVVYRQLVALRPNDEALAAKLTALESSASVASNVVAPETVGTAEVADVAETAETTEVADAAEIPETAETAGIAEVALTPEAAEVAEAFEASAPALQEHDTEPTPTGPTAREFFAAFAVRAVTATAPVPVTGASGEFATFALPATNVVAGGSLDALFGHVAPTAADENVALAYAAVANAVEPTEPPIKGKPTQPAASELSLDSVFREPRARATPSQKPFTRQSQMLRFDQFFSATDSEAEAPPAPPTPSNEPGSAADLEQFGGWLKGLKDQ
ncbi:MAG: tetratricopeptide repeat protein [Gemmatimonadetes bacterium]|nr:tetratricopeptide repeat protein [Gemmatimonadota bacterium]